MKFYLDTGAVIYTIEQVPHYAKWIDKRLSGVDVVRVVSELTRLECRVKPLRDGDLDLLKDYDVFFEEAVSEIVSLSREVMEYATEIRAKYKIKTPDAIHLSAAVISNCDIFLTNDHRLSQFKGLTIEIIQP